MYKDYTFIFDIDGTLCPIKKADEEYADLIPYEDMIERIRFYKERGAKIILYTSRNMNSYDGRIGLINKNTAPVLLKWLEKWDIPYDEIVYGKLWPGHKGFYVDDRTVRPDEFLNESVEELENICASSRCGSSGEAKEDKEQEYPAGKATAYVDGSYDVESGRYSYGAVIFCGGNREEFFECFDDSEMAAMRNVAGEIEGSKKAMSYCLERGITELNLYFDYEGIRAWCTGQWKANKEGTKAYKAFYEEASKKLRVNFIKVKSHSGVEFNERADKLAKEALNRLP